MNLCAFISTILMCSSTLKNTKYCLSPPQPFPDSANKVRHQEETGLLERSRWEGEGPAGTMQEAPRRAWALQLNVMLLGHCLCCGGHCSAGCSDHPVPQSEL